MILQNVALAATDTVLTLSAAASAQVGELIQIESEIVAVQQAVTENAKVQLLAGGELFGEAEDPAVAADQQGFRGLRDGRAACGHPGSLERHPEADAVTLAEIVGKR